MKKNDSDNGLFVDNEFGDDFEDDFEEEDDFAKGNKSDDDHQDIFEKSRSKEQKQADP